MEAVEEEAQRMAVEVVEGVQGEGEVLKHRQGLMVGGVVAEVQVVPRHGPVGLASRPAERLPASLARKQRSLPAQDLEGSPQRQGQQHWTFCALSPTPLAPAPAVPGARARVLVLALGLASLSPAAPGAPFPGAPRAPSPASAAPAAPVPGAPSLASLVLVVLSPTFPSPFAPSPAPSVAAALAVAFSGFPSLLGMGHFELEQVAVNSV